MRNLLVLALVSALSAGLIGCDSAGSDDETGPGSNDETLTEIEGQFRMITVDQQSIPFLEREEAVDVPQTGHPARCEVWYLEDALIFTFQKEGGVFAKRIETLECTTLEGPIYSYSGKVKSERAGRYSRVGRDLSIVWQEEFLWTGTILGDVVTLAIPGNDPELNAPVASFKKQ